ncbi:hornerin-like [Iris pallida]|uniref:Hornerin-like n=1 Tax=Iris pallida TaxID=29817 RepID=A0AAX6HYM3_IRIPA|nr:hornerin-like [Iris pallida]
MNKESSPCLRNTTPTVSITMVDVAYHNQYTIVSAVSGPILSVSLPTSSSLQQIQTLVSKSGTETGRKSKSDPNTQKKETRTLTLTRAATFQPPRRWPEPLTRSEPFALPSAVPHLGVYPVLELVLRPAPLLRTHRADLATTTCSEGLTDLRRQRSSNPGRAVAEHPEVRRAPGTSGRSHHHLRLS